MDFCKSTFLLCVPCPHCLGPSALFHHHQGFFAWEAVARRIGSDVIRSQLENPKALGAAAPMEEGQCCSCWVSWVRGTESASQPQDHMSFLSLAGRVAAAHVILYLTSSRVGQAGWPELSLHQCRLKSCAAAWRPTQGQRTQRWAQCHQGLSSYPQEAGFYSLSGVLLRACGDRYSWGLSILIGFSKWYLKIPFLRFSDGGEEYNLLSVTVSNLILRNFGEEPASLPDLLLGLLLPEWALI